MGGGNNQAAVGMVRSVLCFGAQQSMKWCAPKPWTVRTARHCLLERAAKSTMQEPPLLRRRGGTERFRFFVRWPDRQL